MWNDWDDYDFWAEDNGPAPDTLTDNHRQMKDEGTVTCDDCGDWEDFAFVGGLLGIIEEENEEERRVRKEVEDDWNELIDD